MCVNTNYLQSQSKIFNYSYTGNRSVNLSQFINERVKLQILEEDCEDIEAELANRI